jgi:hypothetical protein
MSFPKWCYEGTYLPNIEDIKALPKYWNWSHDDFIHHNPLWTPFQILNDEFISSLSKEILDIIKNLLKPNITILEVGAWNGRLTYFLRKNLVRKNIKKKVALIATDNHSRFDAEDPYIYVRKIHWIPVKEYDIKKSIEKYNPNIIISSWMPDNIDWTEDFRNNESIQSFILIWNPEECGNRESWSNCQKFQWQEIIIKWNICWQDNLSITKRQKSKVVIFKRKNTK